jgi:hypothetical protein
MLTANFIFLPSFAPLALLRFPPFSLFFLPHPFFCLHLPHDYANRNGGKGRGREREHREQRIPPIRLQLVSSYLRGGGGGREREREREIKIKVAWEGEEENGKG